jgi:HSP20 family protein
VSIMRFDPFSDPFRQVDRLTSQLLSGARTPLGMPMDVWQAEDGYHVAMDLPGVDPSSVEITHEQRLLTIRAERHAEYGAEEPVLIAERPMGVFTRQLQLADALDAGHVHAEYADGVLRLTIPVAQEALPRRIPIETGGSRTIDLTSGEQAPATTTSEQAPASTGTS